MSKEIYGSGGSWELGMVDPGFPQRAQHKGLCLFSGTFLGPGPGADMGQSESEPQDEQEVGAV